MLLSSDQLLLFCMNTLVVEASLSFFLKNKKNEPLNRIYKSGLIVDFSIRKGMFNSGKIEFEENKTIMSGEKNIKAIITFAYGELVSPFIKEGSTFVFGEPSTPYGNCKILTLWK